MSLPSIFQGISCIIPSEGHTIVYLTRMHELVYVCHRLALEKMHINMLHTFKAVP